MPRPIIMTEKMKRKARKDFAEMLNGVKMTDGKLSYNMTYEYKDANAIVWLTPEAYRKTLALVTGFSSEVAWHGTVTRTTNNEFIVEDILVYPQEVTGSTVSTDQVAYSQWLYEQTGETFSNLRMQGHSHVNMGVSPSGVDNQHRAGILAQLEPDMFYIFMVWNKSLHVHALIYDMARNVLYEDDDIDVKLQGDEKMDVFLADAVEKVKKMSHRKTASGVRSQVAAHTKATAHTDSTTYTPQAINPADYDDYHYYGMYDPYDLGGPTWRL